MAGVLLNAEEAGFVAQLLNRATAQNKDAIVMKTKLMAKLLPYLPDDPKPPAPEKPGIEKPPSR